MHGITDKTSETITTTTYFVGNYDNGDKGLPFTATLETGETEDVTIRFAKASIISMANGCTITWALDGYKKALTSYKREWNQLSKQYGDQPKIMKLEIRAN